jgi:DNA-binding transcriptional MerR regulator/methylmalonyl-CoA mutase cobalamin-binding subunit
MDDRGLYTIRYVAQRTGLTPHVIRAWEKRYQAVVPLRSPTNRRLYSEDDVRRLQMLKQLTDTGHTISRVAGLTPHDLLNLARHEASVAPQTRKIIQSKRQPTTDEYFNACLSAVTDLDPDGLEQAYAQAAIDLTRPMLLNNVIVPLFEKIGDMWRNGELKIVNEHMATSVTRVFLRNILRATAVSASAPKIFISTAVGQWHDLGALTVALTAAEIGWRAIYYGPNLPVEEIAAGVKQCGARAVAVSITHQLDPIPLVDELRKLRRYLERDVTIFVGGRFPEKHAHFFQGLDAIHIATIDRLGAELDALLDVKVA